jgi:hypothetical protein
MSPRRNMNPEESLASTRPGRAQRDDGGRWRAHGRRMSAKEQRDARRGRAAVATAAVQGQGGGGRAGRRWRRRGRGGAPA